MKTYKLINPNELMANIIMDYSDEDGNTCAFISLVDLEREISECQTFEFNKEVSLWKKLKNYLNHMK